MCLLSIKRVLFFILLWLHRFDSEYILSGYTLERTNFLRDRSNNETLLVYPKPCPSGASMGRQFCQAQNMEDVYAYLQYFYGEKNGTIVESGAVDGVRFSTTWMFEKALSWQSIHVEADPVSYTHLKANRPNAINIHAALCPEQDSVHWINSGPLGEVTHGIYEFMSEQYLNDVHPYIKRNGINVSEIYPTIRCEEVSRLLARHGVNHVQLWVLDVEGAEERVLKTFNFSAVKVDVIAVECLAGGKEMSARTITDEKQRAIDRVLAPLVAHGYQCQRPRSPLAPEFSTCKRLSKMRAATERNCWCVREGFRPSAWRPHPPANVQRGSNACAAQFPAPAPMVP